MKCYGTHRNVIHKEQKWPKVLNGTALPTNNCDHQLKILTRHHNISDRIQKKQSISLSTVSGIYYIVKLARESVFGEDMARDRSAFR